MLAGGISWLACRDGLDTRKIFKQLTNTLLHSLFGAYVTAHLPIGVQLSVVRTFGTTCGVD